MKLILHVLYLKRFFIIYNNYRYIIEIQINVIYMIVVILFNLIKILFINYSLFYFYLIYNFLTNEYNT